MKDVLTMQSLTATHYDHGDHILEFDLDGRTAFLTVRGLGPVDDEFYWDDEERVAQAVSDADLDDIDFEEQMVDIERLGKNVAKARKSAGVTQVELAKIVDKSQARIAEWENGVKTMSIENFVLLASALRADPASLLDGVLARSHDRP